jgi:hypothetical protein
MDIEEIKKILKEKKDYLKIKYGVKEIGIFDSYVKGEEKEKSDIDILVEFEKPIGLIKFIELENYLTDLFGIKVDLGMKSALKPKIGEHISKEVIYL